MLNPVLAAAFVVSMCVGPAAAQPNPPIITDPAWFTWYQSLLQQRLAECPLSRSQTYFFAQSGDDQTGNGTPALPWKTLAKARAILAAAPAGDVALLFRRGDVWREAVGLDISTPNITIADYGFGDKPLFTVFQPLGPDGWAPLAQDVNVFWRSAPERVMWAKQDNDLDRPWSRQRTLGGVGSTEGSWFWDTEGGGVLYVHPRHGVDGHATDPRIDGNAYEAAGEVAVSGVRLRGDGSRVQNIRTQGWGLTTELGTHIHGIELRVEDSDRAVAVGCESHYGLGHVMTQLSIAGGIATFVDCRAGLTSVAGFGGTMFNTYSYNGGVQTIFDHCIATHGTLPSDELPAGARLGIGFYGHASYAYGSLLGLTIANACTARDTAWGCSTCAEFANTLPAPKLQDVRCFIVGETFEGGPGTGETSAIASPDTARVNGTYRFRPGATGAPWVGTTAGGWVINCTIDLDCTDRPGDYALFTDTYSQPSLAHFWNNAFTIRTRPGQTFRFDASTPPYSSGTDIVNCIIQTTGGGICKPNISPPPPLQSPRGGPPSALRSNAYLGVDAATVAADHRAVILPALEPLAAQLSCSSSLACTAGYLPEGLTLGYDSRGRCCVRDDIGPVEAPVCANCDASTIAPVLNIQDYSCFINKFAAGDPGANCDGSTAEPTLNIGDFICFQAAFARGCK